MMKMMMMMMMMMMMFQKQQSNFVSEVSSRLPGLECSYGKNFIPVEGDLGRKNRDVGNRASVASHMNTKERMAEYKDLGNRASPVDRAHMKRPSIR